MYISAYILHLIVGLDVFRFIDLLYFLYIFFLNNVNIVNLIFLLFLMSKFYLLLFCHH